MAIDGSQIERHLNSLLAQSERTQRRRARSLLSGMVTPTLSLIWGGSYSPYRVWYAILVVLTPLVICAVAALFNWYGRPLPGGVYSLILWIAVICIGPYAAHWMRRKEMRHRNSIDPNSFVEEMRRLAPDVPDAFSLSVRRALAAAYCVPVSLIGPTDTGRECNSLSVMSVPFALEIMADISRDLRLDLDYERLGSSAECFRKDRVSKMFELVNLLYVRMGSPTVA